MTNLYVQESTAGVFPLSNGQKNRGGRTVYLLRSSAIQQGILLTLTGLLLLGSFVLSQNQRLAYAANPGNGNACGWYRVHTGDTLTRLAAADHISLWTLAHVNAIPNANLIFIGQQLCVPYHVASGGQNYSGGGGGSSYGLLANGYVSWYAYNALQWSTRAQVNSLLRQVAINYGLPINLLLAIAWQESGWTQHVIARDGGIGVMQLMPYTAMSINAGTGIRRNPYLLWDNLNLGATYLHWLWINFRGNLVKVISAYNEGGWAVIHRGVFNWGYVNSVLALMRTFR
jgi:hypothetical protein